MTEIRIDKLFRSRRRTIGLEINQDAGLIVRAPRHVSLGEIQNILLKKRSWIVKKQTLLRQHKDQYTPKKFIDGESFYYLGKPYQLNLVNEGTIRLSDYLEFPRALLIDARQQLIRWYRAVAYEKIKERVDGYSKTIGLSYSKIKISGAAKRLGSCSHHGYLNFSWRLIMAPLEIVDYVVVHELIHLKEKNHSRSFWNKVSAVLPDYREKESFLKRNYRLFEL